MNDGIVRQTTRASRAGIPVPVLALVFIGLAASNAGGD